MQILHASPLLPFSRASPKAVFAPLSRHKIPCMPSPQFRGNFNISKSHFHDIFSHTFSVVFSSFSPPSPYVLLSPQIGPL